MRKKKTKIPKFRNLEEEARFWDTHSFADYWDEFEDVELVVGLHKPKKETLVLRLQKSLKNKLEKIARSRGLNVSTLARMWLMERAQTSKHT